MRICKYCKKPIAKKDVWNPDNDGNGYHHECLIDMEFKSRDRQIYNKGKMDMLDKIRAEIEAKCCITVGRENDGAITLHDVFEIIDKYRVENKESREEKQEKQELKQESVLDKIRAEIEVSKWTNKDVRIERNALASGLDKALEIIDKYKECEDAFHVGRMIGQMQRQLEIELSLEVEEYELVDLGNGMYKARRIVGDKE